MAVDGGIKKSQALVNTIGTIGQTLSKSAKWTAAALGASAVIGIAGWIIDLHEKQIQLAQENAKAYAESAKSIEAYKKESIDLINSIESGTLSEEDAYKSRARLVEIEKSLASEYGKEAGNLNLLTSAAKDAEESFDSLSQTQAENYLRDNKKDIAKAIKKMDEERSYTIGRFNWDMLSKNTQDAISDLVDANKNLKLIETDNGTGDYFLSVVGNAQEASDALKSLPDDLNEIDVSLKRMGEDGLSMYFMSTANAAIDANNKIVSKLMDDYGLTYTEAVNAKIAANKDYTDTLISLENAESDYTKVMSESYDSTEERAKAMSDAYDVVGNAITEYNEKKERIATESPEVARYFDEEIKTLENYQSLLSFDKEIATVSFGGRAASEEVNTVVAALDKLRNAAGKIDADYINSIGLGIEDGIDNEQEQAYSDLVAALDDYGIELQDAIPILKAYGIMQKSVGSILGDATKAYNTVIAEQEAVNNAYKSQSPGKSVSLDTYKSLIALSDEYANCLEYENGALQLNRRELMQLSKARAEENLLTIESNQLEARQRYEENTQLISKYRAEIRGARGDAEKLIPTWEDYIEKLEEQNKAIKESIVEYSLMAAAVRESISEYSDWVNAQSETQASAWHESVVSGLAQIKKAYTNKEYGNTALQEGLEFLTNANITGESDPIKRIDEINKAYKQLSTRIEGTSYSINSFLQPGKTGANNFLHAIQQINSEWASFDYATQRWTLNYDDDESMGQLAKDLGVSVDFIKMMNSLLEQYGFEFDSDDSGAKDDLENIDKAVDLVDKYKQILADTNELKKDGISADEGKEIGAAQAQLDTLASQLATLPRETLINIGFNLEGVSDDDIIDVIKKQIPTLGTVDKAIGLAKEYKQILADTNKLREGGVSVDDGKKISEYQLQLDSLASQLAEIPRETLIGLGFDLEGVSEEDLIKVIKEQIPTLNIPIDVSPTSDSSAQGESKSEQGSEGSTVVANVELNYSKELEGLTGVAEVELNYSKELEGLTGTAAVTCVYTNFPPSGSGGSGGNSGTGGTGGVSGSLQTSGPARANGNIGAMPGGKTLVGELGREMYVDPATNTWHTIGDNGAEFVDLPKNAIVFNHLQTESLLSNGKIPARGKALASGNAAAMMYRWDTAGPAAASGGPSLDPPRTTSSGGSGSKKKSFKKLYKEYQHLLAMDQVTTAEYLAWLEAAYQEAYEKKKITLDEYNKYMEEVYELQKEVFMDSLNDIEHQISILEREDGNESKIIEMYQGMLESLEAEIQAARDRGLDDNSDYIQELQDQYYSYMDEIEDIQDTITENAKDAVDELVDFKLDMIKQDLENEKDALNDRLDDLRDFYDKQKEMLQDAHDEEKYLEEQKEKRKSVSDIQSEIAQLSRDNSAWAHKRRLELQEELLEAQKELDDFEKDHSYDEAQDFLDKMQKQQEEQLQSQIEAIDEKLNDPNALYNQALAAIQNNTADLYNEMVDYNNKHGDGNPETIQKMWDDAYESLNAYLKLFAEAYKDIVLAGSSETVSGYASGTRSATPGIHSVYEEGEEYIFKASDGTRYKMFSGGEKVLNARATNFLYDFATSSGAILTSIFDKMLGSMSLGNIRPTTNTLQLSTGDIIIQGNATDRTVSEIRRAQRDNIDYILKEFHKLNR